MWLSLGFVLVCSLPVLRGQASAFSQAETLLAVCRYDRGVRSPAFVLDCFYVVFVGHVEVDKQDAAQCLVTDRWTITESIQDFCSMPRPNQSRTTAAKASPPISTHGHQLIRNFPSSRPSLSITLRRPPTPTTLPLLLLLLLLLSPLLLLHRTPTLPIRERKRTRMPIRPCAATQTPRAPCKQNGPKPKTEQRAAAYQSRRESKIPCQGSELGVEVERG